MKLLLLGYAERLWYHIQHVIYCVINPYYCQYEKLDPSILSFNMISEVNQQQFKQKAGCCHPYRGCSILPSEVEPPPLDWLRRICPTTAANVFQYIPVAN